jgi:hypothetical protein
MNQATTALYALLSTVFSRRSAISLRPTLFSSFHRFSLSSRRFFSRSQEPSPFTLVNHNRCEPVLSFVERATNPARSAIPFIYSPGCSNSYVSKSRPDPHNLFTLRANKVFVRYVVWRKSRSSLSLPVIPAKAGIQYLPQNVSILQENEFSNANV